MLPPLPRLTLASATDARLCRKRAKMATSAEQVEEQLPISRVRVESMDDTSRSDENNTGRRYKNELAALEAHRKATLVWQEACCYTYTRPETYVTWSEYAKEQVPSLAEFNRRRIHRRPAITRLIVTVAVLLPLMLGTGIFLLAADMFWALEAEEVVEYNNCARIGAPFLTPTGVYFHNATVERPYYDEEFANEPYNVYVEYICKSPFQVVAVGYREPDPVEFANLPSDIIPKLYFFTRSGRRLRDEYAAERERRTPTLHRTTAFVVTRIFGSLLVFFSLLIIILWTVSYCHRRKLGSSWSE